MMSRIAPLLHALHGSGGLPWLKDIAARFALLAAKGQAPGPAEQADLLHGVLSVGQLLSQLADELHAEQAALTRRDQALTRREAALIERIEEARSAGEELQNLADIADSRILTLRRLVER